MPSSPSAADRPPPDQGDEISAVLPVVGTTVTTLRREHGPGELQISRDELAFVATEPHGPPTVVQPLVDDDLVTVTMARLRPRSANSFLMLTVGTGRLRVAVSSAQRHVLVEALRDAGIEVRETRSWMAPR